jgi:hypothetical protein
LASLPLETPPTPLFCRLCLYPTSPLP